MFSFLSFHLQTHLDLFFETDLWRSWGTSWLIQQVQSLLTVSSSFSILTTILEDLIFIYLFIWFFPTVERRPAGVSGRTHNGPINARWLIYYVFSCFHCWNKSMSYLKGCVCWSYWCLLQCVFFLHIVMCLLGVIGLLTVRKTDGPGWSVSVSLHKAEETLRLTGPYAVLMKES